MFESRLTLRQQGIRQRSLRKHCRLGRATELVFVLATGVTMVLSGASVDAADLQYDAGADAGVGVVTGGTGNFSNSSAEFNDGGANTNPTATDNVFFGGNNVGLNNDTVTGYSVFVNDPGANVTVTVNDLVVDTASITILGSGDDSLDIDGVLRVTDGNSLTLSAPITDTLTIGNGSGAASNGTLSISGGTAGAVTQNTVNGVVNISGGTYGGTWQTQSGATRVVGASTITGNLDLDDGTALVNSDLTLNGGSGTLDIASGVGAAIIADGITLDGSINAANGTPGGVSATAIGASTVTGNVTVSGGQALIGGSAGTTTVGGVVRVTGGELEVSRGLTVQDTLGGGGNTDVSISSGATLDLNAGGDIIADTVAVAGNLDLGGTINGELDAQSGADIDVDGESTVTGGTTIASGASFDLDSTLAGNVTTNGSASIGGTLNGMLTVAGDTAVVDGDSTISTSVIVGAGGTLDVDESLNVGASGMTVQGILDVDLDGTETLTSNVTVDGAGVASISGNMQGGLTLNGGTASAVIDGDSTISTGATIGSGNSLTVNAGLTNGLNAGTGIALNSGGTLDFDSSIDGNVTIASGATLYDQDANLSGNLSNAGATNASIAGNIGGTFSQSGGTTNIDGDSTVTGAVSIGSGTVQIDGGTTVEASSGVTIGDGAGGAGDAQFNVVGDFTGGVTIDSDGRLNVSNGFSTNNAALSNSGEIVNAGGGNYTVDVGTGTYTGQGTIDAGAGQVTISANEIELRAGHSTSGTVALNANLVDYGIDATIAASQTSDIEVTNGATLDINANATVGVDDNGVSSNGSTDPNNTTDVVVEGGSTLNIASGVSLTAASFSNEANGNMSIGGNASIVGTGNTYNNAGNVTIADGGSITDNGGINNLATGAITIDGNATLDADADNSGGESITNQNSIVVNSTGATTVTVGNDAFVQSGTGTLDINSGANVTGITTLSNTSSSANAINLGGNTTLDADTIASFAGTITAGDGATDALLQSNQVTISGGQLSVNRASVDADAALGGAQTALTVTDAGAVSITGGSTIDGTLDIQDGNATIGVSTLAGNVTIGDGDGNAALLTQSGGQVITVQNNSTFTVNDDGTLDFNANVTGSAGQPLVIVEGGNFTQRTTLTGDIAVNDGNATIADASSSTLNGDLLVGDSDGVAASVQFTNAVNMSGDPSNRITVGSDGSLHVDSNVTGTTGNTILEVNGDAINHGQVTIGGSSITGNIDVNTGDVTIDAGSTIAGNVGLDEGTFTTNAATFVNGNVTVGDNDGVAPADAATFTTNAALDLTFTASNLITVNNDGTLDVNANLTGTNGNTIVQIDGGTASISGSSVTGNIDLNSGTLNVLTSSSTIDGNVTVGDGTNAATFNVDTVTAFTTGDSITVVTNGTLDVNAGLTGTADETIISQSGGQTSIGGTTAATVVGDIDVNGGVLTVDGSAPVAFNSLITVDNATMTVNNDITFDGADDFIQVGAVGLLNVNNGIDASASSVDVIDIVGGSASIAANDTITGNIDVDNGNVTIGGGVTTTVQGDLLVGDGVGVGDATVIVNDTIAFTANGEQIIVESDGVLDVNSSITGSATGDTVLDVNGGNVDIGNSSILGSVEIDGTTVDIDGLAMVNGTITVGASAAAELDINDNQVLRSTNAVMINANSTLDANGDLRASNAGGFDNAAGTAFVLDGGQASLSTAGDAITIVGDASIDSGAVTVEGNTTVDGNIALGDGVGGPSTDATMVVNLGQELELGTGHTITVQEDATLDINGTLDGTDGQTAIHLTGATATGPQLAIGGNIDGDLDIDEGVASLDGPAQITGSVTLDGNLNSVGATLHITDGNALTLAGGGNQINVQGDGVLDIDENLTDTQGNTVVSLDDGGTASIAGATVTGDIDILDGTVTIDGASTITGDATVGDGTDAADSSVFDITAGNALTISGGISVGNDGLLEVNENLTRTAAGTVITNNAGNVAINDATVTGDINVTAGVVTIEAASTLDGNASIGDGAGGPGSAMLDVDAALVMNDAADSIQVNSDGTVDIDAVVTGTDENTLIQLTAAAGAQASIDANLVGDVDIQSGNVTIGGTTAGLSLNSDIAVGDGSGATANLQIAQNITLSDAANDLITVEDDGRLDINGDVTGANNQTLIRLQGDANTAQASIDANLIGDVDVQAGSVTIAGTTPTLSLNSGINVGDGSGATATVQIAQDVTFSDPSNDVIVVEDDGTLDIDDTVTGANGQTLIRLQGDTNTAQASIDGNVIGDVDIQDGDVTIGSAITLDGSVNVGDGDTVAARLDIDGATVVTSGDVIVVEDDGSLDVTDTITGTAGQTVIRMQASSNDGTNEGEATIDANVTGDIEILDGDATIASTGPAQITGAITIGDNDAPGSTDENLLSNVTITNALSLLPAGSNAITVRDDGRLSVGSSLAGADGSDVLVVDGTNGEGEVTISGPSVAGDVSINNGNVTISSALGLDGDIHLGDGNTAAGASLVIDGNLGMTAGGEDSIVVEDDGSMHVNADITGTSGNTILEVAGDGGTADVTIGGSTITGDVIVNSGDVTIDAAVQMNDDFSLGNGGGGAANLLVNSSLTLDINDVFSVASDGNVTIGSSAIIDNTGASAAATFNAGSDVTLNSGAQFVGDVNVLGNLIARNGGPLITGNVTIGGSASVDLTDGTSGDSHTITGNFVGSGGTVGLDIDLTEGAQTNDVLTINGTSSGNVNIAFNDVTPGGQIYGALPDSGIVLIDSDPGSTLTASSSNVPIDPNGSVTYSIGTDANGDVALFSAGNAATVGLNGAIAAAQSLISATINRPTSPFVTSLSPEARGFVEDAVISSQGVLEADLASGVWVRMSGGSADARVSASGRTTVTSDTTSTYGGIQFGADIASFGGDFEGGWDLYLGVTGGYNTASTEQPIENEVLGTTGSVTKLDLEQTYVGLYLVGVSGRFSFDLQTRYERTDYTVNSEVKVGPGLAVDDTKFSTDAYTVSGAVSYTLGVPNAPNMFFVPTAGLSFTKTNATEVKLTNGDRVKFDETNTRFAFAGATLAWANFNETTGAQTALFGTFTHYNNLSDDPESTVLFASGQQEEVSATALPDYSEFSIGYVFNRETGRTKTGTLRKLSASVRADARYGEDFESFGLTAQMRFQF